MGYKPTYEELEQRVKELEKDIGEIKKREQHLVSEHDSLSTLYNAATTIGSNLTLDAVLQAAVQQITGALGSAGCAISLWHRDRSEVETLVYYSKNFSENKDKPGEIFNLYKFPSTLHVLETGQSILIQIDNTAADAAELAYMKENNIVTLLMLPVETSNKVIGLLEIFEEKKIRVYSPDEIRLSESLASQVAISIENASLYANSQHEIAIRKQAVKALRKSEHRYHSLFDSVPIGLYRTTPDDQIIDANPALLDILGYPDKETLSRLNKRDVYVNGEDRLRLQVIMKREGVVTNFETQMRRHNGAVIWVRENARAVYDVDHQVLYYDGSLESITDQKRASEKIIRQSKVLNGINKVFREGLNCESSKEVASECLTIAEELTGSKFGFIGELNSTGLFDTIAISNPGWDVCKMPDSEATRLIKDMKLRGIDRSTIREEKSRIVNDPAFHPDRVGTPEGHPRLTSFLGVPLKNLDKTIGMIGLANKASGYDRPDQEAIETLSVSFVEALMRKRGEEALRKSHEKLEQLVKRRTAKLSKANKDLNAAMKETNDANRAKSDFLARMSHELRTPLNAIIGFSEVLRDKLFGPLNEKQGQYVGNILKSGKHLLSLINDILDISKVEAGKMELDLHRVNIKNLLENSTALIKEMAYKHGIHIDHHISQELRDLEVIGDEKKLKQVLFNLLSNAIKFSPEGGTIAVSAKKEGNELILSVSDAGTGIAPEHQDNIFDEFYQVKGIGSEKIAGTGLGLSLTKSFVEMHGGKIWVKSEGIGQGSRFSFTLPIISEHLEEGFIPVRFDLSSSEVSSDEDMCRSLEKIINFSNVFNKNFTLCRWHTDKEHLKEKRLDIKLIFEKEKRALDYLIIDKYDCMNIVLLGADRKQANIACDQFKKKIASVVGGSEVPYSMAVFPADGETPEALLAKMGLNSV